MSNSSLNTKKSFGEKAASFIKSFTPYQIIYLVAVFVITIAFVIIFPDQMLEDRSSTFVLVCSVIAVLANPICELLISKQSRLNFLVDIFFIEIPEFIICLWNGWYAIAVVTLAFWIPIDIISYRKWVKNLDEEKDELTVVKHLTPLQDVLVVIAIIAFSVIVGSLIRLIPEASDSYLDALAAGCGMANGILLLLRYTEQWYAWFITLILYTVLYIAGGAYIMLITVAAMLINTCYGYVKWIIYTKKHENAQLKASQTAHEK